MPTRSPGRMPLAMRARSMISTDSAMSAKVGRDDPSTTASTGGYRSAAARTTVGIVVMRTVIVVPHRVTCRPPPGSTHRASRFSAKASGPSSWSGWPQSDASSSGPGLAGVGEPELERSPQGALGGGHGRRGVLGDRLGQLLGRVPEPLGRVDDLADHPQLVGPRRRRSARTARPGPSSSPPRRASCASARSASRRRPGRSTRGGRRKRRRRRR